MVHPPKRKASSGLGSAVSRILLGFLHMVRVRSGFEGERKEVEQGWKEGGREGWREGGKGAGRQGGTGE